jgi:hypothetical protein
MAVPPDREEDEWSALYASLRSLLQRRGHESPFGEGDFWLVDDDWGGALQKVCVFRIAFLTPPLVVEVQELLRGRFPGWGVMFQLEIGGSTDVVPPEGLVVYHDRIDEAWNKAKLKAVLGEDFAW